MLKNLSLILTLYGRWHFTERFLNQLLALNNKPKLIIVYGNVDRAAILKAMQSECLKELAPTLIFNPSPEGTVANYLSKISQAIDKIETPYAMLVDNDDEWDFEILKECINEMTLKHGVIGIRPRVKEFRCFDKHDKSSGKENSVRRYYARPMVSLDGEKPVLRVSQYLNGLDTSDCWLAFYSIFETQTFCKSWRGVLHDAEHDAISFELSFMFHVLAEGKILSLNKFGYFRQLHDETSSSLFRSGMNIIEYIVVNDSLTKIHRVTSLIFKPADCPKVHSLISKLLVGWSVGVYVSNLPRLLVRTIQSTKKVVRAIRSFS